METIGKLLDTAQDSGTGVGPSQADFNMAYRYGNNLNMSIVRFVVRDLDELRETAYQQAVDDARKRAQRLARLNGVRLGDVLSVTETFVSGDDAQSNQARYYGGYPQQSATAAEEPSLSTETFSDVTFQVRLAVRFAIAGPAEKPTDKPAPEAVAPAPAAPAGDEAKPPPAENSKPAQP
jgi:hypothetical protein